MNNLSLVVTDQTDTGCYHVKLLINEKDSGILYIEPSQFDFVVRSFWRACTSEGIPFNIENPFDETELDDAEEFDKE